MSIRAALRCAKNRIAPVIRHRAAVPSLALCLLYILSLLWYISPSQCLASQSATFGSSQDSTTPIIAALRTGDFDEALQKSSEALKRYPRDYRLWTLRGMAFSGKREMASALSAYQHALRLAPAYLPALEGAAQIEYQQGSERAEPLLLRVLALRPDDPTTHAMLASLDFRGNQCADAVPHFQQAAAVLEAQPVLLTEFASCLTALDRDQDAIPILQRVLTLDPSRPSARYNLALAQWNAGHTPDAIETIEPLLESNPDDEDVLTLGADIYESNNDTPRAVELLRHAILANPRKVEAYLQFSTLSYNHASFQVGIDMLAAGLTRLPNDPRLYLARAVLYSEKGDYAKATEDFDTVNRLDPNLAIADVAEGLSQSEQHKSKAALASFREAARAHPNDAFAQYLLAETLSEQQTRPGTAEYAEAVSAARRAADLNPRMSSALDLLSTLFLRAGHAQEAINYSRKALSINPNDQQALYHLMLALRKTDQRDEVPAILKRLIAARNAQSTTTKKRYKLDEGP